MPKPAEFDSSPYRSKGLVDDFKMEVEQETVQAQILTVARELIDSCKSNPYELLRLVAQQGTPAFILHDNLFSRFVFRWLVPHWGFVSSMQPKRFAFRTPILNWLLPRFCRRVYTGPEGVSDFGRRTLGFFILPDSVVNMGFLSYQVHHWLSFRTGLAGYNERASELYQQQTHQKRASFEKSLKKMSLDDMRSLKAAINREMEALLFLKNITLEVLIPRRQAQQLGLEGNASA